jgi:SAM-dependent methyltransferase
MHPVAPTDPSLFDNYVENYDAACDCGLRYVGETCDYFAQRRVAYTGRRGAALTVVRRIMDFGCGPGRAIPHLLEAFPMATVLGIDNAAAMIETARSRFGGERAVFVCGPPDPNQHHTDLIYCNGVFHHVPPPERPAVVGTLFACLRPGGLIAFWENNPWNPGTRLVMSRIPFDRDAVPLSYPESKALLASAGFALLETTFHFFFPFALRALRRLERWLVRAPLGGQYCVLAMKPFCHGPALSSENLQSGYQLDQAA